MLLNKELVARNKTLEEENLVLKYSDNQTSLPVLLRLFMIYLFERNLIHEEKTNTNGSKEFDERRILMLKCQIYQLEKQVKFYYVCVYFFFVSIKCFQLIFLYR